MPYEGTLLPQADSPEYVRQGLEAIARNGQFPMPTRTWEKVGLPEGVEKQVWDAWAPGAPRKWKNVSPGYTNVVYDAKVCDGVVSLLLDGGGLVQSADGGKFWEPVSHHLTYSPTGFYSFDINPADPDIIAVSGSVINRSLNGGRSWETVWDNTVPAMIPTPTTVNFESKKEKRALYRNSMAFGRIRFNADGSRVFTAPGGLGHNLRPRKYIENEMRLNLDNRKYIYVGDGSVSDFKAIDLGTFAGVRSISPHLSNPDLVYVSFSDGSIFVCRNACSENPEFTNLELPQSMQGLQAVSVDISPDDENTLLLVMVDQGEDPFARDKLYVATVSGDALSCRELNAGNERFTSAKYNPLNGLEAFFGKFGSGKSYVISTDGLQSFEVRRFPEELFPSEHVTGYKYISWFAFDTKSTLAIAYSFTGAWLTRDGFNTVEELVMKHDQENRFFGNKGVGFAECAKSACIRGMYTYIATNDHGAWRSKGDDTSMWEKISDNPGMPKSDHNNNRLAFPMAVSDDEEFVYLVYRTRNYSNEDHKLMQSTDWGDSWQDITPRLGVGDVVENGIEDIFFDPENSANQWILSGDELFYSGDGGQTFSMFKSPARKANFAYDSPHGILYASNRDILMESRDMGENWTPLPYRFSNRIYALSLVNESDLVIADDGRLIVIPFDAIGKGEIDQEMIRLTIGENPSEAAYGLRTFKPIVCHEGKILTFTSDGVNRSNAMKSLGALLSDDQGKTFKWITYDMPNSSDVYGCDMSDEKIIFGNRGIFELDISGQ